MDALKLIATMKGFRVSEAAEQALFDWIERNRPPNVTVNVYNPVSVSVTKVDKIEVQLIAEELKRLTKILSSCQNEYRDRWRKELFQKLRKAMVLEERT